MKLVPILIACTTVAGQCISAAQMQSRVFLPVHLDEPLNWIADCGFFLDNVIAGYNADLNNYTAQEWAQYVLGQCRSFAACTSSITYSVINSGTPKDRFWFGYVFRGGPTTQANYTREDNVEDSIAYSEVA